MASCDVFPPSEASLLKQLECFKCRTLMKPPIMVCGKGHSICNKCFEVLTFCPLCKTSYRKVLRDAFDGLQNYVFHCPYGCKYSRIKGTSTPTNVHLVSGDDPVFRFQCDGCFKMLNLVPFHDSLIPLHVFEAARMKFKPDRNVELEKLAELVEYPCEHEGCGEMFKLADHIQHLVRCSQRHLNCLDQVMCAWRGPIHAMNFHLLGDLPLSHMRPLTFKNYEQIHIPLIVLPTPHPNYEHLIICLDGALRNELFKFGLKTLENGSIISSIQRYAKLSMAENIRCQLYVSTVSKPKDYSGFDIGVPYLSAAGKYGEIGTGLLLLDSEFIDPLGCITLSLLIYDSPSDELIDCFLENSTSMFQPKESTCQETDYYSAEETTEQQCVKAGQNSDQKPVKAKSFSLLKQDTPSELRKDSPHPKATDVEPSNITVSEIGCQTVGIMKIMRTKIIVYPKSYYLMEILGDSVITQITILFGALTEKYEDKHEKGFVVYGTKDQTDEARRIIMFRMGEDNRLPSPTPNVPLEHYPLLDYEDASNKTGWSQTGALFESSLKPEYNAPPPANALPTLDNSGMPVSSFRPIQAEQTSNVDYDTVDPFNFMLRSPVPEMEPQTHNPAKEFQQVSAPADKTQSSVMLSSSKSPSAFSVSSMPTTWSRNSASAASTDKKGNFSFSVIVEGSFPQDKTQLPPEPDAKSLSGNAENPASMSQGYAAIINLLSKESSDDNRRHTSRSIVNNTSKRANSVIGFRSPNDTRAAISSMSPAHSSYAAVFPSYQTPAMGSASPPRYSARQHGSRSEIASLSASSSMSLFPRDDPASRSFRRGSSSVIQRSSSSDVFYSDSDNAFTHLPDVPLLPRELGFVSASSTLGDISSAAEQTTPRHSNKPWFPTAPRLNEGSRSGYERESSVPTFSAIGNSSMISQTGGYLSQPVQRPSPDGDALHRYLSGSREIPPGSIVFVPYSPSGPGGYSMVAPDASGSSLQQSSRRPRPF